MAYRNMALQKVVGAFATVFVTFEVSGSSRVAEICCFVFKGVIILAIISYLASTEPIMRYATIRRDFFFDDCGNTIKKINLFTSEIPGNTNHECSENSFLFLIFSTECSSL
jgi:hypothetical protein